MRHPLTALELDSGLKLSYILMFTFPKMSNIIPKSRILIIEVLEKARLSAPQPFPQHTLTVTEVTQSPCY